METMRYPATLWPRGGRGRNLLMHTRSFGGFRSGVRPAVALPPAHAADEIEAKAQLCAACHGDKGFLPIRRPFRPSGASSKLPHEAAARLRNGERASTIMAPIAKGLGRGRLRQDRRLLRGQDLAGKRASAKPPAAPKGIASARRAISRARGRPCRRAAGRAE